MRVQAQPKHEEVEECKRSSTEVETNTFPNGEFVRSSQLSADLAKNKKVAD